MKRKLDKDLSLIYTYGYPYKNPNPKNLPFTATIGIGGNVGNVKKRFKKLFQIFSNRSDISVVATSTILKNPPFGFKNQPDFLNAVMVIRTSKRPKNLLKFLLKTEKRFKRVRSFKNAPRTLDLDIIFFDNRKIDEESLKIPHPKWKERASVVIPLLNIEEML